MALKYINDANLEVLMKVLKDVCTESPNNLPRRILMNIAIYPGENRNLPKAEENEKKSISPASVTLLKIF